MSLFYANRFVASLAITALTVTSTPVVAMANDTQVKSTYNVQSTQSLINTLIRLGGYDRYTTAVQIADHGWQSASTAVLAPSGDRNMVDALASSSLAKAVDGPILLADKDSVPSSTMIELKKLGVTKVYLVSGTAVMSAKVESELTAAGIQSVRLGGYDRYETAVNIAKEIQRIKPFQEVVVTNAYSNVDAISIAPIAAAKGIPVLLVDKDSVPKVVSDFIQSSGINKTYVIGGTAVVSASVKDAFPNATRLSGNDRFDTNTEVLKRFKNLIAGGSMFFANGSDTSLIDSLTGAPMAAKLGGAIVLSNKEDVPVGTKGLIQTDISLKNPVILGGTAVMSDSAVQSLGYAQPSQSAIINGAVELNTPNATFKDVTVNGNVLVDADGETLQNVIVKGTVFVDPGKDGSATLDGVKATRIVVLSGADHSIRLKGTKSESLVVSSSSDVRVVAETGTTLGSTLVQSNATVESQIGANVGPLSAHPRLAASINVQIQGTFSNDVSLSGSVKLTSAAGAVVPTVKVTGAATPDSIQLAGMFASVSISDNSSMTLVSGKIDKMNTAGTSNIVVKSGAEVTSLSSATGKTTVSGGGTVNDQTTTDTPGKVGTIPSAPVVSHRDSSGGNTGSADQTVAAVKAEIELLPVAESVQLSDEAAIVKAREDYTLLTVAQKSLVGNISKLRDVETALAMLKGQIKILIPVSVSAVSDTRIDVTFSQPVTAESTKGLQIFDGDTYTNSIATYEGNVVHLILSTPLNINTSYSVWIGAQYVGNIEGAATQEIMVSGTISLQQGETVPAEGLDIQVFAYPTQGGYGGTGTTVHLKAGETSVGYTLTIGPAVQGLVVGYQVDSKYGYINGWYGQDGVMTPKQADSTTVNPKSNNINLTLMKGVAVEGTIQLLASLNQDVHVNVNASDNEGNFQTSVLVHANETSAKFTLIMPNDPNATYTFGYNIDPQYGYVQQGYYKSAEAMTSDYSAVSRLTLDEAKASSLTLTMIKGEEISGTISLPQGETVPSEGLDIYVSANPTQGGYGSTGTTVHLKAGENSIGYTLTTDPAVQGLVVGYQVYSKISYINGWYGQNGVMTTHQADSTTVNPKSNNINLMLIKGVAVDGTVQLPTGQTFNQDVWVGINASNNEENYQTSVLIRASETSANFTLIVPNDPNATYTFGYNIDPQFGYVQQGFYKSAEAMTSDRGAASSLTLDGVKASGLNLTMIKGEKICGTISLPQGETVPAKGLDIQVFASPTQGGYGYTTTTVHLKAGETSVGYYLITDPAVQGSFVGYQVYSKISYINGWYGQNGVMTPNQAESITVNPRSDYINLTLIKGVAVDGTIQLPTGETFNQDVWVGVNTFNNEGNYQTSVLIRAHEASANFTLIMPNDPIATYIFGYNIDPQYGYVQQGYYKSDTVTTSDSSALSMLTVDVAKTSGLTLTMIKGEKISGTISLPQGETVPAKGLDIQVFANPTQGFYGYTTTTAHLKSGETSVGYTLTTDPAVQDLVVGYQVDSKYGYINGWYGKNGVMTPNQAEFTTVNPRSDDINLTLIKGVAVDGTIQLPTGLNQDVQVNVNASNNEGNYQTSVLVRALQTSANFTLIVPNDANTTYTFSYNIDPQYGYVQQGYYKDIAGMTSDSAAASNLTLDGVKASGLILTMIKGEKICGTISLPQGETVPANGLDIQVSASPTQGGYGYTTTMMHLKSGETSIGYTLATDPSVQGYVVGYQVYSKISYVNGWYGQNGVMTTHQDDSTTINPKADNINLMLINGVAVYGAIQLPTGETFNQDVWVGVNASNNEGNYQTSVLIRAHETSANFRLILPNDPNVTYVYSYNIDPRYGYAQQCYYKSTEEMTSDYGAASRLTLDEAKAAGLTLNMIKEEKISGTISLPQGETVPAEGLDIKIFANPIQGNGGTGTMVHLKSGETSVGYTFTIDPSSQGFVVGYWVDSKFGYFNGWYGQNGVMTPNKADSTTVNPMSSDINLTLIKGVAIDGTLQLPIGQTFNQDVQVNVNASNNEGNFQTSVLVRAHETSAKFTLILPNDPIATYSYGYNLDPQYGYVPQGYYKSAVEMTPDYNVASRLTVGEVKASGLNLTMIKGEKISGALTLESSILKTMQENATQKIDFGFNKGGLTVKDQYGRVIDMAGGNNHFKVITETTNSYVVTAYGSASVGQDQISVVAVAAGSATVRFNLVDEDQVVKDTHDVTISEPGNVHDEFLTVIDTKSLTFSVIKDTDIKGYTMDTIENAIYAGATATELVAPTGRNSAYDANPSVYGTTSSGAKVVLASGTLILRAWVDNTTDFAVDVATLTPYPLGAYDSVHVVAGKLDNNRTSGSTTLVVALMGADDMIHTLTTPIKSSTTEPVASTIGADIDTSVNGISKNATGDVVNIDLVKTAAAGVAFGGLADGNFVTRFGGDGTLGAGDRAKVYLYAKDQYGTKAMPLAQVILGANTLAVDDLTVSIDGKITKATDFVSGDSITLTGVTTNGLQKTIQINFVGSTLDAASSVRAINGTVTVTLSGTPAVTPVASDFVVTQSIGGGDATAIAAGVLGITGATINLIVPTVVATYADQSVVYSVSYKSTTAVAAPAFTIDKIVALAVSSANGTVTVTLSGIPSAVTPVASDFVVTQSIGGGAASTVAVDALGGIGVTINLTVPTVFATAADQSVVYSVSYKGATAVAAPAFTVHASTVLAVSSVSAVNGTVTVILSGTPAVGPVASDFVVTQSIGGGDATAVAAGALGITGATINLTVPTVFATAADQSVVYSVSYKSTTAVAAPAFTINKIVALAVSSANGTVTVTLSGTPAVTPVASDFVVTQSIGGGAATAVVVDALGGIGATINLTVPTVFATAADQSVVYSVSYKGATAVTAPAFTVHA